jgi:phenylacetic acid degradation operon negative regulatory protein
MYDEILSTIKTYPTSHLVYSSLSAFADMFEGELPGTWFVAALRPLGHSPEAIRQTLFRLTGRSVLTARRAGRAKYYRCSSSSRTEIHAGLEKIFLDQQRQWDGNWTLVHYAFADTDRIDRDRVRDMLKVMGFAPLGIGLFVHPRDQTELLEQSIREMGVESHVQIFRSARHGADDNPAFIRSLWDLNDLGERYRAFSTRFGKLSENRELMTGEKAFALRFHVVIEFLRVAWEDPDLPPDLLPGDWHGDQARLLARSLYRQCLPHAREYAASFLRNSTPMGK